MIKIYPIKCFDIQNNKRQFQTIEITLSPSSENTKAIFKKVREKNHKINFNLSSSDGSSRTKEQQKIKSFFGLLAEEIIYKLFSYLNKNSRYYIEQDTSTSSFEQIDMKVFDIDKEILKTIEIRSSFPFLNIERTISKNFDVLGPYKNNIKPSEKDKDFYIRLLFSLDYIEELYVKNNDNKIDYSLTTLNTLQNLYISDNFELKKKLKVYFVGGATNEMMYNQRLLTQENMESSNFNQNHQGNFKRIKLRFALDAIELFKEIFHE